MFSLFKLDLNWKIITTVSHCYDLVSCIPSVDYIKNSLDRYEKKTLIVHVNQENSIQSH